LRDNFILLIKNVGGCLVAGADIGIVLAYSAGIMLIFMFSWILLRPLKFIGRILVNSILGGILIVAFNFFSRFTGVYIGVNEVTALVVGLLGIPGFAAVLIVNLII
jgi:inhibitor of the pro-sigma K processing machinery